MVKPTKEGAAPQPTDDDVVPEPVSVGDQPAATSLIRDEADAVVVIRETATEIGLIVEIMTGIAEGRLSARVIADGLRV